LYLAKNNDGQEEGKDSKEGAIVIKLGRCLDACEYFEGV
jgi:hypothetical protein